MRNSINTNNLQETVVKIIINGKPVSTGFWAAPNCIITCAHSVEGEVTDLKVEWNNQVFPGLLDWKSDRDYPDLALIKVNIDSHPIVTLSEEVMIGDALYIFGYPLSPTNPIKLVSTGVTAIFESVSFLDKAKEQILLSFKEAQVSVGMSGSPLLNRQTGKVCGVVKSSRNEFTNMGGRATPSELIIANIPEIALFHNEQKKKSQRDLFEHFIDNPYQDILSPPFEWIFIPTGKVSINESLSDEGSWYEVPKFAISKYPITRNQYSNFVKEGGYENNRFWSDDQLHRWYIKNKLEYSWYNKSISGNCPQTDISYWEALAFCNWLSEKTNDKIFLPTEQQWQRAAQGDSEQSFPWGFKFELTRCNAYANALTPVDLFPNGSSPYNVFDMSGNVWEWCTPIEPLHDIETEEILAVLKGGAWKHTDPDYFQVGFRRIFSADSAGATAGFRIAKVL